MENQGKHSEQLDILRASLAQAQATGDVGTECRTLVSLAWVYSQMKEDLQVVECAQKAIPLLDQVPEQEVRLSAEFLLGSRLLHLGHSKESLAHLRVALQLARECRQEAIIPNFLSYVGSACFEEKRYEEAATYQEEALAKYQAIGDQGLELETWASLGVTYVNMERFNRAIACHQHALELARVLGVRRAEAHALGNLGLAHRDHVHQPLEGLGYFEQALNIYREIGDQAHILQTLADLAVTYLKVEQLDKALPLLEEARTLAIHYEDRIQLGRVLGYLGAAHQALGRPERAQRHYRQALAIEQGIGDRREEKSLHLGALGVVTRKQGKPLEALQLHQEALRIARERGDRLEEANQLGDIANSLLTLNDFRGCWHHYKLALALFQEIEYGIGIAKTLTSMGVALQRQGKYGQCLGYWRRALEFVTNNPPGDEEILKQNLARIQHALGKRRFQHYWLNSTRYYRQLGGISPQRTV